MKIRTCMTQHLVFLQPLPPGRREREGPRGLGQLATWREASGWGGPQDTGEERGRGQRQPSPHRPPAGVSPALGRGGLGPPQSTEGDVTDEGAVGSPDRAISESATVPFCVPSAGPRPSDFLELDSRRLCGTLGGGAASTPTPSVRPITLQTARGLHPIGRRLCRKHGGFQRQRL